MSAFANLKHFDFFKDVQNWFMPFYPDHETVNVIYRDEILGPAPMSLQKPCIKPLLSATPTIFHFFSTSNTFPHSEKHDAQSIPDGTGKPWPDGG